MISLLDYGAGNVRSVINAIESLGQQVSVISKPEEIAKSETLVFPGVGNFGAMMTILNDRDYIEPLKTYLAADRPFLGICLGLQALFEMSEEAPGQPGLGFIPGQVLRFRHNLSVPHIGWNNVTVTQPSRLFNELDGDEHFYFVHSYYVAPASPSVTLTTTDYGTQFVSAIQQGNVIATQFHPEKSGTAGLAVLRSFLDITAPARRPPRSVSPTKLAKRVIACLDVRANDTGDLVVTKGDQYDVREKGDVRNLGKPVALARRYYEQGADEITFLNITGFRNSPLADLPMLEVLRQTSENVFVPLTIGGGIRDYTADTGEQYSALDVAAAYFRSGADKISIGSDAVAIVEAYLATGSVTGTSAIETISRVYGNQAVVVSIDPRRVYEKSADAGRHHLIETAHTGPNGERFCWYECTTQGGRSGSNVDAVTLAQVCETLGAGEILLNCIDRDGTNTGFDLELIQAVAAAVSIPVIASSGAGNAEHFRQVFIETDVESALAAGIFHRNEVPIGAVKKHLKATLPIRR